VKLDTIRRAINSGKLRAKRTGAEGGGKYLITESALRDWLESLEDG
jgi:excisionase family DNA binding protein